MFCRRNWIAFTVVIFGLIMFMPDAQAQRQEFEATQCYAATINIVHSTPELGISSLDCKGITQSTHESKLFDNWTRHMVLVIKRIDGKTSWNGVTKAMAPDGEFIIWEFSGDSQAGSITKAVYGTGKWKDVKGELKAGSEMVLLFSYLYVGVLMFRQKVSYTAEPVEKPFSIE